MLTRRSALLGSASSSRAHFRAARAARRAAHATAGAQGAKKERSPAGSPGDTPLGPVDTAARWAFIQDFTTGATLLEKTRTTRCRLRR